MADRYWVGGTAAWDATAGTKWATTSGGTGGASVPTSADDVFFSNLSTGTCTISTGNTGAKSINCTGFTGTIAGSGAITISGSVTLSSGMTYTHSGTVTFDATGTVTTAGKTFSALTVNGSGITVTLGDNLNLGSRNLTVTAGTFNTSASSFSIVAGSISSSNTNVRTIILNGSTITLGSSVALSVPTNLTFNAGTSQINLTNASSSINAPGQTFYNISFTSTSLVSPIISGAATFNNLTFAARNSTGVGNLILTGNQTINGTLTIQSGATDPTRRLLISSDTLGTTRIITSAANVIFGADFRDITAAGAGSWTDSSRTNYWGDCKGNTGITFATGRSVYWNLSGAQNWSATGWATSSGGTPSVANFPLAQDTAVFDNTGSVTGIITVDNTWNIGSVDMSARTSAMTLTTIALYSVYGNWTNGSGTTLAGANTITFSGRTTQTIISAGKTFTCPITVDSPSGTVTLADNLTTSSAFIFSSGTLNLANNTLTALTFNANVSTTRTLQFGTGNITVTGSGSGLFAFGGTNFTYTGTPTINISNNSAASATITVSAGFTETNTLNYNITTGTYALTLNAARVRNLNFTGFAGTLLNNTRTIYGNLTVSSGMTLSAGGTVTTFAATSGTQTITTNGKTLDFPITINGVGGTVQLADDLTLGATRTLYVQAGTFDANNSNVTTGIFRSDGANTRSIIMGSGNWTLAGTSSVWNIGTIPQSNITLNAGTSTIILSDTSVTSRSFLGGGLTYNNLTIGGTTGTSVFTFYGSNNFNTLSSTKTVSHTLLFDSGTTNTFTTFNINGTAGNVVTIGSTMTAANATIAKAGGGTVTADYLSISYSTATPTLTWLATNSTDGGNNSGWYFGAFPSTASSGNYFLLF